MENIELLEREIWKDIPNTNNMYKISNYGRIYGIYRKKLLRTGKRAYVELCVNSVSFCIVIPKILRELFTEQEDKSKWKKVDSLENEIWKPIKNYENLYEISNLGRVKSLDKEIFHYNSINNIKFITEFIMKTELNKVGYYRVNLIKDGKYSHKAIHRLVAEAFIPNPENKPCVNHINGIKTDNRIENLEWVTHSENTIHAYKNNLQYARRGEECNYSKINNEIAKEIKLYLSKKEENKLSLQEIADLIGVTRTIVKDIYSGRSWKHIQI